MSQKAEAVRARPSTPAHQAVLLKAPSEPVLLARNLRRLLGEDPEKAHLDIPKRLSARLWRDWGEELRHAGATPRLLRLICAGYEREIWLWLLGDRPWSQMLSGLRGRLLRRL